MKLKKFLHDLKRSLSLHIFLFSISLGVFCRVFSLKGVYTESIRKKIIEKLKKKYKKRLKTFKEKIDKASQELPHNINKKIWVCWFQGIDNAPDIVKICYQSLLDNFQEYEITVITEGNYSSFITLPDYILKKYKKGYISKAHFSDLIRLELLIKYGGIWIDSTVFFTGSKIPDFILNSDLFVFSVLYPDRYVYATSTENWFISACTNNKILLLIRDLLFEYWTKYNFAVDYLIFYDFFELAINAYPEEWSKVVPYNHSSVMCLCYMLFDQFDPEKWERMKGISPLYKLTYKLDETGLKKEGTYYKFILDNFKCYGK